MKQFNIVVAAVKIDLKMSTVYKIIKKKRMKQSSSVIGVRFTIVKRTPITEPKEDNKTKEINEKTHKQCYGNNS